MTFAPNETQLDRVGSCEFSGIPNRESYMEIPLNSRCAQEQRETHHDLRGCCPRLRARSFTRGVIGNADGQVPLFSAY
jgi:hypothetical protein